jgi:hypothetical protein
MGELGRGVLFLGGGGGGGPCGLSSWGLRIGLRSMFAFWGDVKECRFSLLETFVL